MYALVIFTCIACSDELNIDEANTNISNEEFGEKMKQVYIHVLEADSEVNFEDFKDCSVMIGSQFIGEEKYTLAHYNDLVIKLADYHDKSAEKEIFEDKKKLANYHKMDKVIQ